MPKEPVNKDIATKAIADYEKRTARSADLKAKREAERERRSGESKAEAFKRIAENRLNKALDAIATISSLSAKANYDYTDEQAKTIVDALHAETDKLAANFAAGGPARAERRVTL